ncbi:MAG: hypothetical protein M1582_03915, partial [Actinobacteria bacterium]|nr:hypothetical protein [Actinomycetota bacterium]
MDEATVEPATGGTLGSRDGKLTVHFPAAAASERLAVSHRRLDPHIAAGLRLVRRFALNAYALERGNAEVKQFALPVQLTFHFSPEDIPGLNPDNLGFYYRDPDTLQWVYVPSTVDLDAQTVTASVDHFTEFSVQTDPNVSAPGLIMGFQNDLHSGMAVASYPIKVPQGPGGLQPALTLSYNSGVADEMRGLRATGSWVGIGWSLNLGSVSYDETTGKYYLTLNGQGYELMKDGSGTWHTKQESYLKIQSRIWSGNDDGDGPDDTIGWDIWDKDGTYYQFGEAVFPAAAGTDTHTQQYYRTWTGSRWDLHFYRIDLKKIRDTSGNEIVIHYFQDTQADCSHSPCNPYVRAANPKHI